MFIQFSAGETYTKQAGNGEGEMTKNALPPPVDRCNTGFTEPKIVCEVPHIVVTQYKSTIASNKMGRVQNPLAGSSTWSGEQLGYAFFHIKTLCTNTMEHSSVAKVMSGHYSTTGTVQLKRKGVKDDLGWGGVGCGVRSI